MVCSGIADSLHSFSCFSAGLAVDRCPCTYLAVPHCSQRGFATGICCLTGLHIPLPVTAGSLSNAFDRSPFNRLRMCCRPCLWHVPPSVPFLHMRGVIDVSDPAEDARSCSVASLPTVVQGLLARLQPLHLCCVKGEEGSCPCLRLCCSLCGAQASHTELL